MSTVGQLLKEKGSSIWSVLPEATVFDALKIMAERNVGAVVIMKDGEILGIFSERDYARKVVLQDKTSKTTAVSELMTEKVFFVKPEDTLEECMVLMTNKHIRHLPVVDNGKLTGIISIGDVVNRVIKNQEFSIKQLESYISGGLF